MSLIMKINFLKTGVIYDHDFENIKSFDESKITEEVERAWYKDDEALLH